MNYYMKKYKKVINWAVKVTENDSEHYVISHFSHRYKKYEVMKLWRVNGETTFYYSFAPTERYNRFSNWDINLVHSLLEDFAAEKVRVLHSGENLYTVLCKRVSKFAARPAIEAIKSKESAPFVLYGTFPNNKKEYAWKLNPDKPKRQGLQPDDIAVVWANGSCRRVKVTRIEPADGLPEPTARVLKKVHSKQRQAKVPESVNA